MQKDRLRPSLAVDREHPFGPGVARRTQRLVDHLGQVGKAQVQLHRAVFQHTQIKQIVQQPGQPYRLVMDDAGIVHHHFGRQIGLHQNLGKCPDRGHRRAQLMADLAQEGILLHRKLGQLFIGLAQSAGGARQLVLLRFEPGRILHDLGGRVGHRHQVFNRNPGPPDQLADHRMRGGGPHRSGQPPLEILDKFRGRVR